MDGAQHTLERYSACIVVDVSLVFGVPVYEFLVLLGELAYPDWMLVAF